MKGHKEIKRGNYEGKIGAFDAHFMLTIKLYPFGNIEVYGPHNPYPFLFVNYGNDCLEKAYYQICHADNTYHPVGIILSDKQKEPGQSTVPLENRVS